MKKRHLVVLATLLLVFAAPLRACDDEEAQAYLIDEILRLSHEGIPDRIIIKQMRTMDFVFCLTADDIIELRELGVSDDILEAVIETSLDVEEGRQQEVLDVRVSPGYWSPWYRYPSGWGAYYDPFPYQFSWNYYPFLYECGYWYGWSPNIYYYTYYVYETPYDYTPHQGDYREDKKRRLAVRNDRGAIIVDDPLLGPSAPIAIAPLPRKRSGEVDRVIPGRIEAGTINVREPYRSPVVATPRLRNTGSQPTLREARSDVINVKNPAAPVQATPVVQPPRSSRRPPVAERTAPPTVNRRPPATVKSPPVVVPRRGSTTKQVTPPKRRNSTSVKAPPKRTPTRVTPAKRAPTRLTPAKRAPTRVSPPARTPTRTQVKAPARSAPPPKATRPKTTKRSR